MNDSLTRVSVKTALASLIAAMPFMAMAQNAIEMASKPYMEKPAIGFVIASGVTAKPVIAPIAEPKTAVVAPAPAPAPSFELKKGKSVESQLLEFGKQSGWDLIWQAPEYVVDRNMMIQGNFENAVLSFLNGANEAGTRLRAVFYRGNKTVRVTEF